MAGQASLVTVDYVVAAIILLVPMAIGIWYAVKDANKVTRTEYLLGGRQMSVLPVALSMFVTFKSAISMMGIPAEVFVYGYILNVNIVGMALSYVIGYFTLVPLMYPLNITSIYEYLKRRYKSEAVRLLSTGVGILSTIFYMAITVLSPALALQATANVPLWASIALCGIVGTLYTAIGGIKSVVWTDAFQAVIVFVGIFSIIIRACMEVGGFGEVWRLSQEGGRTRLDKFSFDPRVRHTWPSLSVGFCVMWLGSAFNQSTLQRISSTKSLRHARIAFALNIPLLFIYNTIMCLTGLAVYAYYAFHECDPKEAGHISNINQLAPYFVLHAMADIPGMAGLFVSVLCCGSLSTLSSGINALAANTVEDILQKPLRSLRESTITIITKLVSVMYGVVILGLAYMAKSLSGPVTQMTHTVLGAMGSPILGVFLIGGTVPWANKYGALAGAAVSFAFTSWMSIGRKLHGQRTEPLPSIGTKGCSEETCGAALNTSSWSDNLLNVTSSDPEYMPGGDQNDSSPPVGESFFIYDISYEWYSLLGTTVCVLVGLSVSYVTNRMWAGTGTIEDDDALAPTQARYIFPCLRHFWGMEKPDVPRSGLPEEELLVKDKLNRPDAEKDMQIEVVYRGAKNT